MKIPKEIKPEQPIIICRNCRIHKHISSFHNDYFIDCKVCVKKLYKHHLEMAECYRQIGKIYEK